MRQDGIDRSTDVLHASLVQTRLGQLHMGLDRGDVLTQFIVQFGGQVAALVFVRLQVAAGGVTQLMGQLVQSAIDRAQIDVLLGNPFAASAQRIGGRSQHQCAGSGHCQKQVSGGIRRGMTQVLVDQGHAETGDEHGQAGTAPAVAEGKEQHRRQRQHAGELWLRRGLLGQHQQDRHGRQHHQQPVHEQAGQGTLFDPGAQQHDHQRHDQQDAQVVTEDFLAEYADHQFRRARRADQRQQCRIDSGGCRHHQHHGKQQAGHLLRTVQAGMQVESPQQPQADGHYQRLGQFVGRETGPAQRQAMGQADAGSGDQFGAQQPAPVADRGEQQGTEAQAIRQHPVRLHGQPQQQPQQQVASGEQGAGVGQA